MAWNLKLDRSAYRKPTRTLLNWNCTETICVITSDGRVILGQFVGHDQVQNLILNDAQERVYTEDAATEIVELGLYVIRGDNVCLVGDFDPDSWKDVPATPLPPLQQQSKV